MTQAQTASYNPVIIEEEIKLSDSAGQQMAILMQSADEEIQAHRHTGRSDSESQAAQSCEARGNEDQR